MLRTVLIVSVCVLLQLQLRPQSRFPQFLLYINILFDCLPLQAVQMHVASIYAVPVEAAAVGLSEGGANFLRVPPALLASHKFPLAPNPPHTHTPHYVPCLSKNY